MLLVILQLNILIFMNTVCDFIVVFNNYFVFQTYTSYTYRLVCVYMCIKLLQIKK